MNLLRMIIRFVTGSFAITGDLQQFYCCCKLIAEEMNFTRFLYHPDMDPNSEPFEYLFQALIYGLKSASAQTEYMKKKLADESSYVDDMAESKDSREAIGVQF